METILSKPESLIAPDTTASILVVDDNDIIRDTLMAILLQLGHQVVAAHSGDQALQLIAEGQYDLVISDVKMPNMTGIELLEETRRLNPELPFIIITGFPSLNIAIEAMKKGATDFIPKPFDIELIQNLILRTLRERDLARQNKELAQQVNQKTVIENLNRDLNDKVEQLTRMVMINERLALITDNETLFVEAVRVAREVTSCEKVSLMIYDRSTGCLRIRAAQGIDPEIVRKVQVRFGEGVVGKVAQFRRTWLQTKYDSAILRHAMRERNYYTRSFLSVPLMIGEELFGVLNLADKIDRSDFNESDKWLIEHLGEKLAIRVENNILYEGIYSNLIDTLKTLIFTIEARDSYTRQHSQRVTAYSVAVARQLGFSPEEIETMKFATILHDIGKIGISDTVLLKPGKLTPEEFDIIKLHPAIGDAIVEPLGLSEIERRIIRHHHERLDGKGYPDGLRGDEIPMLVRITATADAFDAMTSTRPYRSALTVERAIEELRQGSGTQFDRVAVDALILCHEDGRILPPDSQAFYSTNPLDLQALKTPLTG